LRNFVVYAKPLRAEDQRPMGFTTERDALVAALSAETEVVGASA
jgi:hypothetical protein